ncbi:MAG TPA: hypothetical protein PLD10_02275, partial [Rhodopila sp.]|nr:hypothetical protein [Rhodopila sp.]
ESYLKTATLISGAALPILAVAAVGARPLVLCLLGPNWTGIIHLVPPLAFSYAEALAAPMVGLYLSATGWVRLVPRLAIGLQLSQILCISVSVHFGIYWVAVASITAGLLSFIVNSHYLRRATGITRSQLLFSLWKSVAVTIICLVPAVAMIHLLMIDEHPWLSLMVGGVVSACTWLIAITLVRHPIAGELRLFLRDVRRLPPWRTV